MDNFNTAILFAILFQQFPTFFNIIHTLSANIWTLHNLLNIFDEKTLTFFEIVLLPWLSDAHTASAIHYIWLHFQHVKFSLFSLLALTEYLI